MDTNILLKWFIILRTGSHIFAVDIETLNNSIPIDEEYAQILMMLLRGDEVRTDRGRLPPPEIPSLPVGFNIPKCGALRDPGAINLDLCFIIQLSCHISLTEIEQAKSIMYQTAERLGSFVSIAVVAYSDDAEEIIEFQENGGDFLDAVEKIKRKPDNCRHCNANTDIALNLCGDILRNKGRPDNIYPNAIMIFTDGVTMKSKFTMDRDRRRTIKAADMNALDGATTIVGMFNNTDGHFTGEKEWNAINSPSTRDGVAKLMPFPVSDTSGAFQLDDGLYIDVFADHAARPAPSDLYMALPGCAKPCIQFSDVVIIIDRSLSIPVNDLALVIKFFKSFIENSDINYESGLQVAVISYNSKVMIHADFGKNFSKAELLQKMDDIPVRTAKYTDTASAFIYARHIIKRGAREGSRRNIILATDGRSRGPGDSGPDSTLTIKLANIIKADNTTIYALGLPNKNLIDGLEEWNSIASEPLGCTVINMQQEGFGFKDLFLVGVMLTNELCKDDISQSPCGFNATEAPQRNFTHWLDY
ncbi:unnamed protein product [Owenia fusiformis]|uniref:VWFA domain-containing protein n=1 Tax=Owenia fusiformis TaxID=6347 RepID=A0A8S4ND13_OWEFU|nr:unnamed protein product [Owenia fusiformis]